MTNLTKQEFGRIDDDIGHSTASLAPHLEDAINALDNPNIRETELVEDKLNIDNAKKIIRISSLTIKGRILKAAGTRIRDGIETLYPVMRHNKKLCIQVFNYNAQKNMLIMLEK